MKAIGIGRGGRSGRARLFVLAGLAVLACEKPAPEAGKSDAAKGSVVLARIGKEVVTAGELGALPPNADGKARLEMLVRRKLAIQEARRRGLENDPAVRAEIEVIRNNCARLEEGLLRNAFNKSIHRGMVLSEEDVRAHYEQTKASYVERQWMLRMQSYPNEEEARAAAAALGATGRLDPKQSEVLGPLPASELPRGLLTSLHELQKPGDRVVVPLNRWTVVELVEYLPSAQLPFELVRGKVEQSLRAVRAEELVRAEIDRLRAAKDVSIDEAALAAVRRLAARDARPRRPRPPPSPRSNPRGGSRRAGSREALQLPPRHHHLVHLVGAVGDAQRAALAPHRGDRRVVGHAERAQALDRAVEHVHQHVGHDHLDHRDLLARDLLAVGVHLPGGVEHEQARLVDLHARGRDPVLHELLLADRAAEGDARVGVTAHDLEAAFRHADRAHAVVDAAGPEARLRDHEAAVLGAEAVRDRHPAVLVADLAVPAAARVAHHGDRADQLEARRVGRHDDLALALVRRARPGFVTAITIAKRAPTAPDVNHLWPLIT